MQRKPGRCRGHGGAARALPLPGGRPGRGRLAAVRLPLRQLAGAAARERGQVRQRGAAALVAGRGARALRGRRQVRARRVVWACKARARGSSAQRRPGARASHPARRMRRHWAKIDDHVQAPMARVVGGLDSEVCPWPACRAGRGAPARCHGRVCTACSPHALANSGRVVCGRASRCVRRSRGPDCGDERLVSQRPSDVCALLPPDGGEVTSAARPPLPLRHPCCVCVCVGASPCACLSPCSIPCACTSIYVCVPRQIRNRHGGKDVTVSLSLSIYPGRYKIIMEAKAFPSDRYIVESQVRFHGYDPADAIVLVSPRDGEHTLRCALVSKET